MRKAFAVLIALLISSGCAYAEIRVAVIDTGVSEAVVENVEEGYNYIYPERGTSDIIGHGTAVASIISGSRAAGIKSLCKDAIIIPLVYCTQDTEGNVINGGAEIMAQAIYDAADKYECRVINISSGTFYDKEILRKAVEYACSKGIIIVASAGNNQEKLPYLIHYPAGYEQALSVGACNKYGEEADFSQKNSTVDLLAEGVDVRIATNRGHVKMVDGTSYAVPAVTARICRIWDENPKLSAEDVKSELMKMARNAGGNKVFAGFKDVSENYYCFDSVEWAVEKAITKGTSDYLFSPDKVCTKGEIITFLWRSQGSPGATENNDGMYYDDALRWSETNGISENVNPSEPCSRLDAVKYIYRLNGSERVEKNRTFTDVPDDASEVFWAVANGVTNGTSEDTFSPDKTCTRGEIVTFIFRSMNNSINS